jgi:hypothetical protein
MRLCVRTGWCVVTLCLGAVAVGEGQSTKRRILAPNLFAPPAALLSGNRVACGVNNLGELCVDPGNSPVVGGGFWPKGTVDQYIFNSGLQLAGIVAATPAFAWSGDTTGAYFFDARGTQRHGTPLDAVYDSRTAAHRARWPAAGVVADTAALHRAFLGERSSRPRISGRASGTATRAARAAAAIPWACWSSSAPWRSATPPATRTSSTSFSH